MQNERSIDDETFLAAWSNVDNQKTMRKVAGPYRRFMTGDEADQYMRIGLLNTLKSHDYSRGRKFVSSLRLRTLWVFKTQARSSSRYRGLMDAFADRVAKSGPRRGSACESRVDAWDSVSALMSGLDDDERDVVRLYYMEDMSMDEIVENLGITRHRAYALRRSGMIKLKTLAFNEGQRNGNHAVAPRQA